MGQRLLIVDGDRRFIKDHQAALEAAFDVDYLYSTDGVLPLLESGDFASVLICVEVSENKGYAICSAIRKNPKLADLKLALISAKATEEEYARHRSLKGKADLYLHKPLVSSALVTSLTPLVPPRSVDPDNPLGDLSGADLGDEWLESLKAELETDERPAPVPAPSLPPAPREMPQKSVTSPSLATLAIPLPSALQKIPHVSPDAGKVELLESRVNDLEAKLQDQGNQLSLRDQELQELRWKHDSVTRNLDDLEQQRKDSDLLQQRLMEADNRIQSLEADAARTEESGADLRRTTEESESDRHRLQGLVEDLGRQLSDKERETSSLQEASQHLEAKLAELPDLYNRIQELESGNGQLREGAQRADELQGRNQELEGRIQELQSETARLSDMERRASELQGRVDELRGESARLGAAEQRASELQARIQEFEGRAQDQESRINELQSRLNGQMEQELQLAETRENLSRQEARVSEMQSQRDAKAQELIEKNQEAESLKVDVAGLEATLRGQRRELADQGGRLGNLTRECETLQTKLTQQEERVQELARVLSEKMQFLAERDHEISGLRTAAQQMETALAERTLALEDREKDIVQLRNTKEQLENHCEEVDREMTQIASEHEKQQLELMKGVDEREAEIGRLKTAMEALREQIAGLEREKQAMEGHLNERSARLEALTGAISDLESNIRRASDLTRPF